MRGRGLILKNDFAASLCVSRVLFAIFQINDFLRTRINIYIYIINAAAVCFFFFKQVKLISSRNGKKTVFVYTCIIKPGIRVRSPNQVELLQRVLEKRRRRMIYIRALR